MEELSKYLSQLMKEPIEKEESLDISELLANISPIPHAVAVNNEGNFDIENQHITHSVLLSGSSEISILEDGSI